jgi:hypothetical protein
MTTMSTQPGSSGPILRVPAAITPDFAAIPEELGNVFLSATASYELSSTGWYVRWNEIGAYIGTTDRRKQSALMGMVIIERLLIAHGQGLTTAQLHGYDQPTYVDEMAIETSVYQDYGVGGVHDGEVREDNHRAWDRGSGGPGVHVASFVPAKAYETRDLLRQFALAINLIRAKLPLFADHLSQRISTPLGSTNPLHIPHKDVKSPTRQRNLAAAYDREWRYADDETQWTFGPIWQFDGSNLFVLDRDGSGQTRQIRFAQHECIVDESDGMRLLSAMLLHPGKELTADEVCNEAGVGLPRLPSAMIGEPEVNIIDFMARAREFGLGSSHSSGDESFDWVPENYGLEELTNELIDDLELLLPGLKKSAIESHVASTLKGKGITRRNRHQDGVAYTVGDFKESVAKMRRCERLIADLHEWRREDQSRPHTKVTEQDMASEAVRASQWVIRSVTTAIDEITNENAFLGSYFRRALRTENGRFTLDAGSKWIVVR